MREETRKVSKKITVYIAKDGKEFPEDPWGCEEYEDELLKKEQEKIAERLKFDTKGIDWPSMAHPTNETHEYKWFKISNEQDLVDFCNAYEPYHRDLKNPELVKAYMNGYPDYLCIVYYPDKYEADLYTLSSLVQRFSKFFSLIPKEDAYTLQIPQK